MKFAEVQDNLRATIAGHTFFKDKILVEADKGKSDSTINKTLSDDGACVVVAPPLTGEVQSRTRGAVYTEVTLLVQVMLNPEVDKETDLYQMAGAVVEAALQSSVNRGEASFTLVSIHLSEFAAGLFAYDLMFSTEVRFQ